MRTIEPGIQEKILDTLPDDGPLALELMAQLVANMVLSINGADINTFIACLRRELDLYEET